MERYLSLSRNIAIGAIASLLLACPAFANETDAVGGPNARVELERAVEAQDWDDAVVWVDRLIGIHGRTSQLADYRLQLLMLQGRGDMDSREAALLQREEQLAAWEQELIDREADIANQRQLVAQESQLERHRRRQDELRVLRSLEQTNRAEADLLDSLALENRARAGIINRSGIRCGGYGCYGGNRGVVILDR